jgi:copper chaperone CopZ
MQALELPLPALYGDHHSVAVRKILEALPGVSDVYASPAFQVVGLRFDPKKAGPEAIKKALADHGYESGVPAPAYAAPAGVRSTRKTQVYPGTSSSLAFAQQTLVSEGRPLWPCPGFDVRSPKPVA